MFTTNLLFPILEHIVSYIDVGVIIAERDGRVLYHNPSAGELLGQPTHEPIGSLRRLGSFDLLERLEADRGASDECAPASVASRRFVRFIEAIETRDGRRHIDFNSGLITLPDGATQLRLVLMNDRTDHVQLEAVLNASREHGFLTQDPAMQAVLARACQIAGTRANVLLLGESGTGKSHLARLIHARSQRASAPLVEMNCAAVPEALMESEFFGHVKGAFTGAIQDRAGRFQTASGGTLFLDEVSEIPLHLQAKLLRAVQDQAFERVGSDQTIKVDVRIIAASNRRLREWVDEGRFRADLYYRLAVLPLVIPPLRERPGDIILLAQNHIRRLAERGYPSGVTLTLEARRLLINHAWPGNVRELENAIEHGVICAINGEIRPESLPQEIQNAARQAAPPAPQRAEDASQQEIQAIKRALALANGNRGIAADMLGIDRTTLWRRMNRLGVR